MAKKQKLFNSPLFIGVGKRKFILNLNQYRNAHYRITNTAKIKYKEFMMEQILSSKDKIDKALFIYKVYMKDHRRSDVGNVVSIHQKFFEDAVVELGLIKDDKYENIPMYIGIYGGIDKENPRVEIEVIELTTKNFKYMVELISKLLKDTIGG